MSDYTKTGVVRFPDLTSTFSGMTKLVQVEDEDGDLYWVGLEVGDDDDDLGEAIANGNIWPCDGDDEDEDLNEDD